MEKLTLILSLLMGITVIGYAQNNCLTFDGTDDYVDIPLINLNGGSFSIELWVNPSDITTNLYYDMIRQQPLGGTPDYLIAFQNQNKGTILSFGLNTTASSGYSALEVTINPVTYTNTWHHIAAVYDGSYMKLYDNGIEIGSLGKTGAPISTLTNASTSISGVHGASHSEYYEGKIDEVRIWDDVRTEDEIRQNMYQEPTTTPNLVAYYKLNSSSGTTATDSKGSNNGTLTGGFTFANDATPSPAFFGPKNCLAFDGTDEYVDCGINQTALGTDFTIEAWVYPETAANYRGIGGAHGGDTEGIIFGQYQTDGWAFGFGTGSAYQSVVISNVDLNTWNHIAAVFSSSNYIKVYVNGILAGESTSIGTFDPYGYFWIGRAFVASDRYFDGNIDEFRIWGDIRTKTEIRENMCKTLTGNESGLVAYYTFDNSSGITLQDFSSNADDGTLTNMEDANWVASSAFNTWLNTSSSAWSTTINWSRGSTPVSSDNVGIFTYSGGVNATLDGSATVDNLVLGASSTMTLSSGITLNGNLILENDLDLNGQTITMGSSAYLIEDVGRIYGTTGNITTTRVLSNIDENVAGLGAEITTSANMGSTTITRTHAAADNPVSIERQYQISPATNTGLNATLVSNYNDAELNGQTEADLKLYKSSDGTNWDRQSSSTVSTTNNTIIQTGIDGFSHWTASEGLYLTGNALLLNGTNQYATAPSSNSLQDLTSFTAEVWIKTSSSSDMKIISKVDNVWNNGFQLGIFEYKLYIEARGSSVNTSQISTATFNSGEWTHLAMTWTSGGNLKGLLMECL